MGPGFEPQSDHHFFSMSAIIKTFRLQLREFNSSDAKDLYELNADPEVLKYTGDAPFPDIASAVHFIESYDQYARYGYGRWGMIEQESGDFIGWCGLKYHEELGYTDLGYRIKRPYWGKGYATEAAQACMKMAFEEYGLEMIVGRTAKENEGSVRVLEKLGMKFWKLEECHGIPDALIYRISKPEYLKRT